MPGNGQPDVDDLSRAAKPGPVGATALRDRSGGCLLDATNVSAGVQRPALDGTARVRRST